MRVTDEPRIAVRAEAVTKTYGSGEAAVHALRGVDLTVPVGEMLFISGPSGSGKTTLLSILGCTLHPTSGLAEVLGHDVTAMTDHELTRFRLWKLGFVFQHQNLLGALTARANVRLPLLLRGVPMPEANDRATADLARVGLADKLDRKPGDLSGGQRQRVAIARAVVGRPPLVLADEPTASLDAASGREVMDLMRELIEDLGNTIIMVTHDHRVSEYADRLVFIEDGRLREAPA